MNVNDDTRQTLVRMQGITKRFGPITVLADVDLEIHAGEVLALAGENGAGKSTLIKILAGVHTAYDGEIEINGSRVRFRTPFDANAAGIAVIHQELSLVRSMSVADNVYLGRWPTRYGFVQDRRQMAMCRELLHRLCRLDDLRVSVGSLPIGTQQLIEIAKALSLKARIIVMDEPTSALTTPEVDQLFTLITDLKQRGCGIVYITHKMDEIERIADRITVLRDGRHVGSAPVSTLSRGELVRWIVGRDLEEQYPRRAARPGRERLRISDYRVAGPSRGMLPVVRDVRLSVRSGEVLGLAGLQGAGNSDVLMGLFGACPDRTSGEVWLDGCTVHIHSPRDAIGHGIGLLTNDREATGLILSMSVVANATLADLPRLSPHGWRHPARERDIARRLSREFRIRAASPDVEVRLLSGGNQQKVALAKWLQTDPRVLLLDEPTRGVDIGAKREIYRLIDQWTSRGIAIILITSEMEELLALSDRIAVMHRGMVTAEFPRSNATAESILAAAMGAPVNV